MASTALINGVNYSWGNLSVVLFGNIVIGITKISYKAKQEKTLNHGWGQQPNSIGYGRYQYEGSMELYTDEWRKIVAASPNNDPMQLIGSDIQIVFAGSRVLPTKDVLQYVEFLENPFDASEGDTKLMVTIPLLIAGIQSQK
jgi:hypothetical protein